MDFTLEKWDEKYIKDVAVFADDIKIAENLRDVFPHPYSEAEAKWYINACIEREGREQMCRAIVVDGEAVGSIGVFMQSDVYQKNGEVGYWLAQKCWGKSIMSNAIKQISKLAFEQFPLIRLYAEPFGHNIGSRRALEKAGFALEGIMRNGVFKNGKVHDYCMYALLKEDFQV